MEYLMIRKGVVSGLLPSLGDRLAESNPMPRTFAQRSMMMDAKRNRDLGNPVHH